MTCRGDPIGVHFMSRATETVAPPNLSCHPERRSRSPERSEGEGSLCPASQTLRGVYPERSEWAQGDKRRQAAQVGRPGTSVSVNTYGGKPWPLAGAMCPWHWVEPMDGILNINKTTGMTSHDVVASIRRLLKQKRVGHAGTLDPAASGVLPICIGKGTRVAEYLSESGKAYQAEIVFGVETDTYDSEGAIVRTASTTDLTRARIEQVLQHFTGQQMQLPPRYSAIKLQGQPAYKLARAGEDITLKPRPITIYRLEVIDWLAPRLILAVECSKGTYIRSLAHDIGEQLGCGAYLAALVRTRSGPFSLAESITLEQLAGAVAEDNGQRAARFIYPLDIALQQYPALRLDDVTVERVLHGNAFTYDERTHADLARVYDSAGRFLAIASWDGQRDLWQPRKVFL